MRDKLLQFIMFGIVGLSNTFISYLVYIILIHFEIHYLVASVSGFFLSVLNSFFWNNKYVFKDKNQDRSLWKTLLKTFISYAGTGLILNNILLVLWIDVLNFSEVVGPLVSLIITVPINYLLNKYWAFRKEKEK